MFTSNSIFTKTFLLIVFIVLIVVLLFSFSMVNNQKNALLDVMYSKANTIAKSISLVSADAIVTDDDSFLVEHAQKVINDNTDIQYILISKRGEQSIYNDALSWTLLEKLPKNIAALDTDIVESKIVKSSLFDEKVYHFSYPINFSGIKWGWISIGLSLQQYDVSMKNIYKDSFLLLFGMLAASTLFSYIITRWLVKPILMLNSAAKKIAAGDLSVQVNISQKGEIGELASSFNHMVSALKASDMQLREYNDELEKRVGQRTEELNTLNQQLDQRVKDEVLKRVEQEQILIQQSRFAAMGEMIGNIAHQWRQPLNALGLLMQNIEFAYESDTLDDEYMRRSVEKGNKLTQTMSQTIDDFRNFFKPNKNFEVFSYIEAYHSTMGLIGSSLSNNSITINENIDENVFVSGFMSEFSQVILNILNNAKDALIENRETDRIINVSIYKENGYGCFSIEDNAGGIDKGIMQKVFDPYFTTKDEGKGTGIGLYMSKMIIENNMKGSLTLENSSIGACFTIKVILDNSSVEEKNEYVS